jgi:hypothetical protein
LGSAAGKQGFCLSACLQQQQQQQQQQQHGMAWTQHQEQWLQPPPPKRYFQQGRDVSMCTACLRMSTCPTAARRSLGALCPVNYRFFVSLANFVAFSYLRNVSQRNHKLFQFRSTAFLDLVHRPEF